MIKGIFVAGIAAALGLAVLLMPAGGVAKGFGPHFSHIGPKFFAKSALLHQHHAFRHRDRQFGDLLAGYGYVLPEASSEPTVDLLPSVNLIALWPMLRCQHSRQVVTVPSEDGGTRDITITRC